MPINSSPEYSGPSPLSTYRLQLNLHFTFQDAEKIVPYLQQLGITDLYASPYLQARSGSLHGYDISDHTRLNDDLGGPKAHASLMAALKEAGLGHLLDIVPNHMGIAESANNWWMDVLENGQSSPYAPFFDIDWYPLKTELAGKVLLPVLGDQFGSILERGELQLRYEEGRFRLSYHEHQFPIAPRSSAQVLRLALDLLSEDAEPEAEDVTELESIVTALEHLPDRTRTDEDSVAERRRESMVSRRRLIALHESSTGFPDALREAVEQFNGTAGEPESFDLMEGLLDDQAYRLAFWRVAVEEINYRRFFDINHLAGVRVEVDEVFDATHDLIFQMMADGHVTALRIDHPDGLFDPEGYLDRLQKEASRHAGVERTYIAVEKILTGSETLSEEWPVAGTVGYDFLNRVNGLFVDGDKAGEMSRIYRDFVGERINFSTLGYERKKLILRVALASELNVLSHLLNRISESNRRVRDFTLGALADAMEEMVASFPVYRTYIDAYAGTISDTDRGYIERAARLAIRRNRATSPSIFHFIRDVLLLDWPDDLTDEARDEHRLFVMKFQQLTGPVMAKGVEDTSFYIYNRLISLNEVGGEPDHFGVAPDELHAWLEDRARSWPHSMNTSSTHDTKRSEDVRARINALSEIPDRWADRVEHWCSLNEKLKAEIDEELVPDANDEYLLYQTLIGAWPLVDADATDSSFRERISAYMEKATREAKRHTSWINPNEEFEGAMSAFVEGLLDRSRSAEFLDDFSDFHRGIAEAGAINSLGQTLIKFTAPGVADLYQGQEVWDFSLVDPDNRRNVDYASRQQMLAELKPALADPTVAFAFDLVKNWKDGRIKMAVTHLALELRRRKRQLLSEGSYLPLQTSGNGAAQIFAFGRALGDDRILTIVRRLPLTGSDGGDLLRPSERWPDVRLFGDSGWADAPGYRDLFTGAEVRWERDEDGASLNLGSLLGAFPVALLESR